MRAECRDGRGVCEEDDGGRIDVPGETAEAKVVKVVAESKLIDGVKRLTERVGDVAKVPGLEVLDGLLQERQVLLPSRLEGLKAVLAVEEEEPIDRTGRRFLLSCFDHKLCHCLCVVQQRHPVVCRLRHRCARVDHEAHERHL